MWKWILIIFLLAASLIRPAPAQGASLSQRDTFEDGTNQNWVVGLRGGVPPAPPVNISTGGPAGDGDHYLLLTSKVTGSADPGTRLVVINLTQWTGDYLSAGIRFITMDVNNLGASDLDLRILVADPLAAPSFTSTHIAVSTQAVPVQASNGWTRIVFSIDPLHFTALKGDPAAALSNVAELRIFHNPTAAFPPPTIDAQLGVDNITARLSPWPRSSDYDGDGKADLAVWRKDYPTAPLCSFLIKDSSIPDTTIQFGNSTVDLPVLGDFDGDGKADMAFFRYGQLYCDWWIRRSSDSVITHTQFGTTGDVPVPADYDGDGSTDVSVWRPGDGYWYVLRSSDGVVTQTQWGAGFVFDVPVPGDYDGDGKADYAIWRPGDGYWYILRSSDGGVTYTQWGAGFVNDVPVPGDYDADGRTDIAVWRPGDGFWYIINSSTGLPTFTQWGAGLLNDVPVPGDYDGDGKADIAVWRPGDGFWYILRSSDGLPTFTQWGALGDIPLSQ